MDKQRVPSPWGTSFCDSISFSGPGRWIYVSGQIGALEDGTIVNETFAAEAEQCFARIADYDVARGNAFAGHPPSSATVQVAGLVADARLEVEAVAFIAEAS
jgi:enamine deaminase RidA (YjgF/YER057c/UK114 family)